MIRAAACRLTGAGHDYDSLINMIGEARYVLLGEATHGTHEFYKARAEITKRLIAEKGFSLIAWEADWPDALRVNLLRRKKQRRAQNARTTARPTAPEGEREPPA